MQTNLIKFRLLTVLIFLIIYHFSNAQNIDSISTPKFNDKYSEFVKLLESGNTNIDYKEFRNSFLDSKQFLIKTAQRSLYDSLKNEMFAQAKKSNYQQVIKLTKSMLGIDYTSLYALKYLQQTYKIIGDSANRRKYHDIEFGLIYSITKSGDSKTCQTAWDVIQIEEEYFTINMIGGQLLQQSIDNSEGNICDKMEIKMEDGKTEMYYFRVNKIFSKYPKK